MLSKKYYVKFADMLVMRYDNIYTEQEEHGMTDVNAGYKIAVDGFKRDLIDLFCEDNPAFDSDRFNAYIDNRVKELTRKD